MVLPPLVFPGQTVPWVETNQSKFCIYPRDIHLLLPYGTTLMAYADVHMDVGGC
jgi:hypothetical protein